MKNLPFCFLLEAFWQQRITSCWFSSGFPAVRFLQKQELASSRVQTLLDRRVAWSGQEFCHSTLIWTRLETRLQNTNPFILKPNTKYNFCQGNLKINQYLNSSGNLPRKKINLSLPFFVYYQHVTGEWEVFVLFLCICVGAFFFFFFYFYVYVWVPVVGTFWDQTENHRRFVASLCWILPQPTFTFKYY